MVEVLSNKGHSSTTFIDGRDLSVKVSPPPCRYSSCPGWKMGTLSSCVDLLHVINFNTLMKGIDFHMIQFEFINNSDKTGRQSYMTSCVPWQNMNSAVLLLTQVHPTMIKHLPSSTTIEVPTKVHSIQKRGEYWLQEQWSVVSWSYITNWELSLHGATIFQYKHTYGASTSLEARFQPLTSNLLSTVSSKYIPDHETFPGMRMYES